MGFLLGGCGNKEQKQQREEPQTSGEIFTLTGEFQGLADSHSAEVIVDGEAQSYQFFDEDVAAVLEGLDAGTTIQFDVENNAENQLQMIVKLYEAPAEGEGASIINRDIEEDGDLTTEVAVLFLCGEKGCINLF